MQRDSFRTIMMDEGITPVVIDTFFAYYDLLAKGETGMMDRTQIEPPFPEAVVPFEQLSEKDESLLDQLVVVKLNGGLGTSMGLTRAKSLLPVKNGLNFLDITARQVLHMRKTLGRRIPILFMNSFSTDKDTRDYLAKYPDLPVKDLPLGFLQNKFPRVRQDNLGPLSDPDPEQNWNPPGHGDIYTALVITGLLDKLVSQGYRYCFVSNSDNLGATVSEAILTHFARLQIPFLMEVCLRTEMDKKGGHLAATKGGRLVLRESAQCPEEEKAEFEDVALYRYFNTNNLWIDLTVLKRVMDENKGIIMLPIIRNPKVVNGVPVFQIETAMGSAISVFPGSQALVVPRSRFAPVKKTNDLLAIWSDAYQLSDDYTVALDPSLQEAPVVSLDEHYYKNIDQMLERFKGGIPSLIDCEKLTITGDVAFGEGVVLRGNVNLSASKPAFLTHCVVEGNA